MFSSVSGNIVINLLPQCARGSSPITDSIESEIEQHGKINTDSYVSGEWICDDCLGAEKKEEKEYSSSHASQYDNIGTASKSDVSPNTPKADEANL